MSKFNAVSRLQQTMVTHSELRGLSAKQIRERAPEFADILANQIMRDRAELVAILSNQVQERGK